MAASTTRPSRRIAHHDLARAGAGNDRATLADAPHVPERHQDGM